ncbi:GLUG motif-containing protein [Adlercreutzia equolifaciens]|uniref:beta strand repeat-containing protein n=1 Tax=Adlercreutzia equolifaciens TaxID=446660 RepID=UPI0023B06739|nr:GLUG motif-containing protein [Adlercreutzia equolifaciens]MDE8703308.1 GLUG motif-containing protein [Adlercreutzia equolifaciens]
MSVPLTAPATRAERTAPTAHSYDAKASAAAGQHRSPGSSTRRTSWAWAFVAFALFALLCWQPAAWAAESDAAAADGTPATSTAASSNSTATSDAGSSSQDTSTQSIFAGGSGTAANPYTIATVDQLEAFRDSVNAGTDYQGKVIELTADVTLPSDSWTPIGVATRKSSGLATGSTPFAGTFNGDGHTISGLTISSTSGSDYAIGLFGALDGATIENLTLADVAIDVPTSELAGAAAGLMVDDATVSNVQVSGKVSGLAGIGGVVGRMTLTGTIENCTNNADVSALGGVGNVGGIVGAAYYTTPDGTMTISSCSNTGTITGTEAVGGIAGLNSSFVDNCTNSGAITGSNYSVGGIVGEQKNYGGISQCTNTGTIENQSEKGYGTGGIVGWVRYDGATSAYAASSAVSVTNNTNRGTVHGGNDAGGIVGTFYNGGTVTGNTNEASSLSATTFGGGIVGNLQNAATGTVPSTVKEGITVENNVSTTPVSAISSSLKDAYAYNNDPTDFTVANNGTAWVASTNHTAFASLQNALDQAADGGTVTLTADSTDQAPVTLSSDKAVNLDLAGHTLMFAQAPGITADAGTLTITGTGNVGTTDPSSTADLLKDAKDGTSQGTIKLQGGTYDTNVEPYVDSGYAELVLHDATDGMRYTVLPADQAKDQAKAAVTYQGQTEYFENADDAAAAAADEPGSTLTSLDSSSGSGDSGDTPSSTTGGDNNPGGSTDDNTGTTTPGGTTGDGTDDNPGDTTGDSTGDQTDTTPGTDDQPTNPDGSGTTSDGTTDSHPSSTAQSHADGDDDSSNNATSDDGNGNGIDTMDETVTVTEVGSTPSNSSASHTTTISASRSVPQTGDPLVDAIIAISILGIVAAGTIVLARARMKRSRS